MARALGDDERARILELHAAGESRNAIARAVERSPGTVTAVVRAAGLSFERGPEVAAATAAKKADNATRRASSVERLYDLAESLLDRLEADTFKATGDCFGEVRVTEVSRDATPPADVRSLSSSVANLLHSAAKLEAVDAGKGNSEGVVSLLGALVDGLRDEYQDTTAPPEPADD